MYFQNNEVKVMKEYCNYAVIDIETGELLVHGEKYKEKDGLPYLGTYRLRHHFPILYTYGRIAVIKGRMVTITYLFNVPIGTPWRDVQHGGMLFGLQ